MNLMFARPGQINLATLPVANLIDQSGGKKDVSESVLALMVVLPMLMMSRDGVVRGGPALQRKQRNRP